MKILCMYNNSCAIELFDWIEAQGHEVIRISEPIMPTWCDEQKFDLAVSYTYKYILRKQHIEALNDNVVNIHNAYLPWNRGADPNLWSILEQTPRGVTLHYMSEKLDGGDIIAQSIVKLGTNETLDSSYYALDSAAKQLFKNAFSYYDYWQQMRRKQVGAGTYHSVKDGLFMRSLISDYQMHVSDFYAIYHGSK